MFVNHPAQTPTDRVESAAKPAMTLAQRLQGLGDGPVEAVSRAGYLERILHAGAEIEGYMQLRTLGEDHVRAYAAVLGDRSK